MTAFTLTADLPAGRAQLYCSLRPELGPSFRFPLFQQTTYASIDVLSACCGEYPTLVSRPVFSRVCGGCLTEPWTLPASLLFCLERGQWRLDGASKDAAAELFEAHTNTLHAGLLAQEAIELISTILTRASSLYLLSPEGNIRGSSLLTLDRQQMLSRDVFATLGLGSTAVIVA